MGNRTRLTYPDGRTATYRYNEANQVTGISDWSGGLTQHDYDGNGRLVTTTLPSGVTTSYAYDRSGLATRIRHANGASVFGEYGYTYDASGRRVGAVEAGRVISYTYDGMIIIIIFFICEIYEVELTITCIYSACVGTHSSSFRVVAWWLSLPQLLGR